MGLHHSSFQQEEVQASTQETTDGVSSKTFSSKTAKSIELWIELTVVAASTVIFNIEASADGVNFVVVASTSALSATGSFALAVSVDDFPLGTICRGSWTLDTADVTFSMIMGRRE